MSIATSGSTTSSTNSAGTAGPGKKNTGVAIDVVDLGNSFGAAEIAEVMPEFLPTGRYTVRLRVPKAKRNLGTATFLLEDFVPPQIRVAVKTEAMEDSRDAAGMKLLAGWPQSSARVSLAS